MQSSTGPQSDPGRGRVVGGVICIGLGILSAIVGFAAIGAAGGGAGILLVVGILLVISGSRRRRAWLDMQKYTEEIRRGRNS